MLMENESRNPQIGSVCFAALGPGPGRMTRTCLFLLGIGRGKEGNLSAASKWQLTAQEEVGGLYSPPLLRGPYRWRITQFGAFCGEWPAWRSMGDAPS